MNDTQKTPAENPAENLTRPATDGSTAPTAHEQTATAQTDAAATDVAARADAPGAHPNADGRSAEAGQAGEAAEAVPEVGPTPPAPASGGGSLAQDGAGASPPVGAPPIAPPTTPSAAPAAAPSAPHVGQSHASATPHADQLGTPTESPAPPAPEAPPTAPFTATGGTAAGAASVPRRYRPLFGTILWGVILLAFAAFMVIWTIVPTTLDPSLWLLGGVIAIGLLLVVAGIAAASRRAG